ncbi:MAG: GTP-binding protein [Promethearchaeota archaeon]
MSTKPERFDQLIESLMNTNSDIRAIAIVDKDGLIIHSKLREQETDENIIGTVTAVFDSFIQRIKTDFGSAEDFVNIITVDENKILFAAAGPDAILTILAHERASDIPLKVLGNHIAKKIHSVLEGKEVDPTIPQIVIAVANMRTGALPEGDYHAKIIVLGSPGVGKTSLIRRFVDNKFQTSYVSTIGVDISRKTVKLNETCVVSESLWDIGGQWSQLAPYRKKFYQGANFAFVVFDLTRLATFENTKKWIEDLRKSTRDNIPLILIGNKADLAEKKVDDELIKALAEKLKCHYLETSALVGLNVLAAFQYAAYKYLENI